ncbi:class I SAM-dependent methyltransferase [Enterovirga aerilata]|uniref:Class I SAM-dependent methyltransferase n=1 Tax=Enterovirga aerilata TaxID=2730920 RepID=A0A849I3B2_9HYPH|nr:class I SAM-dependent methyltransferase [Enterovirga sp. DB1703]NNM70875.1 class I SAM-dependent methyltransferase [Enterovirga sp. DB1703]
MIDINAAFAKLRDSELNMRVGGADPEQVGAMCFDIVSKYIDVGKATRLLDFGCGAGRVMLSGLRQAPHIKSFVGFDIMEDAIAFFRENIAPDKRTRFELIEGNNDHYDRFVGNSVRKTRDHLRETYGGFFDGAFAFSVFTHVDRDDIGGLLQFVANLLRPGGIFVFTAFILNPYSRKRIRDNSALFKFEFPDFSEDKQVFVGDSRDRLAFIAFDQFLFDSAIVDAGLIPRHIEFGSWRGDNQAGTLQDVIVCGKPF